MIKAIIIDDEADCRSALEIVLNQNHPDILLLDKCKSAQEAIPSIFLHKPDLLFLDIEMPVMNGFDLLDKIKQVPIAVIFTTAFQHYAIKAIKFSALDYLLKPIDPLELKEAITRYEQQTFKPNMEQFQFLIDKLSHKEHTHKKLAVLNMEGFKLISVDDIIACEADDNYTHIHLKKNIKITASRTLKEIQILLTEYDTFIRVHHASLININEVNQYIRGEGGYVIMSDGSHINVSRNKKEALIKRLTGIG